MSLFDSVEILDITPVINPKIAVFPGDTPFEQEFLMNVEKGDHLTLSWMKMTAHLGAHTDAPNHYRFGGESIDKRALEFYLGPAQVIDIPSRRGERIRMPDIKNKAIKAPRVLFKTKSFPDPYQWNNDFMSLSADVINYLAAQNVRLVGIDTPSIDPASDKILESHQAVAKNDMAILEGIVLNKVPEGIYQLIALPLAIEGADATPVRAILLK